MEGLQAYIEDAVEITTATITRSVHLPKLARLVPENRMHCWKCLSFPKAQPAHFQRLPLISSDVESARLPLRQLPLSIDYR